ncbi:hypothetical protein SUGI_0242310 [Cryptomeria japonica]|nr:hypothetical protein SUGI_0242310 [Cryptomeria japonica]
MLASSDVGEHKSGQRGCDWPIENAQWCASETVWLPDVDKKIREVDKEDWIYEALKHFSEDKAVESQHVKTREFESLRDMKQVECLEKRCEVQPSGKISLFTDLKGDPICHVCHSPAYVMLVAEFEPGEEIVELIRTCIEYVTCGKKMPSLYAKAVYILRFHISPTHRRMGIGLKLV